jgi:hypothetical protein
MYILYNNRLVSYANNDIKNNINDLFKRIKTRRSSEGNNALSFNDIFEKVFPELEISTETSLCEMCDYEDLRLALKNLTKDEKELIDFVFFKNYTVLDYAHIKNMCYSTAIVRKKNILRKIHNNISFYY